MDHTLCDTERADQLGMKDFQKILTSDFGHDAAIEIGEMYLRVIYGENRNRPGWQKNPQETEAEYRAKLLEKTIEEVLEKKSTISKLAVYAKLFMDLRIKHFEFFPTVQNMLLQLRKDFKLILISNGPLFSQEPKINKVAMHKFVDDIILGGALEHEKPHPSIFELACQKANCKPNEAIHIGDKLDSDIKGANDYGIVSVWINPDDICTEPQPSPDYIIKNVCELKTLLAQITQTNS